MKFDLQILCRMIAATACGLSLSACAGPSGRIDQGATAARELHAFPAALAGYQRFVIELPAQVHEDERKLELMGGKEMTVDCNARGMGGRFEARDVQGWGYTYWVLESRGNVLSTMMACPAGSAHRDFVHAPSMLVRYNSQLPVVVFVPDGMVLRYRLWHAGATEQAATQ